MKVARTGRVYLVLAITEDVDVMSHFKTCHVVWTIPSAQIPGNIAVLLLPECDGVIYLAR